jgi:heterogeneous nuclear ribonucleoprotein L
MSESSSAPKRQRTNYSNEDEYGYEHQQYGGEGGGRGGPKNHPPSKVVHIRNLNDTVIESDVKRDLQQFGKINKTLFMFKKRQALVEFDDLQSSIRCVTEAGNVRIGGSPAYINYSPYNNLTKHEYIISIRHLRHIL